MRLRKKKYSYKEIKELETELENGKTDMNFLLENIQGLRMLGYTLTVGRPISHKHAYHDVIKVNTELKPNKAILTKKRGTK
jgi:hypothetical protein